MYTADERVPDCGLGLSVAANGGIKSYESLLILVRVEGPGLWFQGSSTGVSDRSAYACVNRRRIHYLYGKCNL